MTRQETVLSYLTQHGIPFSCYNHPEGKTVEEAMRWWRDDGSGRRGGGRWNWVSRRLRRLRILLFLNS